MMKGKRAEGSAEGRMDRAEESIHKEPKAGPKAPHRYEGVGKETKGDVRGDQEGGSKAEAGGIKGAIGELKRQHPEHHMDRGPHHGGESHVRHEPVGKVYR